MHCFLKVQDILASTNKPIKRNFLLVILLPTDPLLVFYPETNSVYAIPKFLYLRLYI